MPPPGALLGHIAGQGVGATESLAFRQALGGESDAIALQLRDTLPNSYDDPDATPDRPINLQQQNAFAAYRNTARMTTGDARAWFNVGLTHEKEGRAVEARQAFEESFKSYQSTSRDM